MKDQELLEKANFMCELCKNTKNLTTYSVEISDNSINNKIILCDTCCNSLEDVQQNSKHWNCLNEAMWSEEPIIQILSYRILNALSSKSWAKDLLDMLYLEPKIQELAQEVSIDKNEQSTFDCNQTKLNDNDTVSIIKDLEVKGAGFVAKRGTVVKNISLTQNKEQVEGKVNGVKIVLLSKFLKKI